jgi:hypothetical protein
MAHGFAFGTVASKTGTSRKLFNMKTKENINK